MADHHTGRCAVRIAAARNLAYLPHYVGISRGYFAEHGLDVRIVEQAPGHGTITDAVVRGDADLVLGSVIFADRLNRTTPSMVAAVSNTQTRHFLFRKSLAGTAAVLSSDAQRQEGTPEVFDWQSLRGSVVLVAPSYVPTSWVAFLEVLHRNNIPLGEIKLLVGYQPEAVVQEFLTGPGDFLLAGGQEAQDPRLVEAVPLAEELGPVPWSVYCATGIWARDHSGELEAFRAGLGKAQMWLAGRTAKGAAAAAGEWFPDIPAAELEATVAQFLRIGFWAKSPLPVPEQFAAWKTALVRAGLLASDTALLTMIDEVSGRHKEGKDRDTDAA
ncbi:ABC transporter substrate-binding protein [Paenarthrobacter sp. NPDC058040]|uniref:ABC transporter substrate-binding protein n=1 Tax=unclassified Paenarthrobacter TaxID=2634190 RepID=UPI0036DD2E7E